VMRLIRAYLSLLERRPLPTKVATSAAIMGLADTIRQFVEQQEKQPKSFHFDSMRTLRQVSFAVLVHVPFIHFYHPMVERMFAPLAVKASKLRLTVAKVAFDQALVAPPFLSFFLATTTLMEGRSLHEARRRIEEQLYPLWRTSVSLWGVAHMVTFNLPIPLRVLWQDIVRLYFGTVMSMRANAPLSVSERPSCVDNDRPGDGRRSVIDQVIEVSDAGRENQCR
jgi:hypothetical protein